MSNHSQYYFLYDKISNSCSPIFQANTDDEAKRMIISSIRQSNQFERLVINDKVLRRIDIDWIDNDQPWSAIPSFICPCSDLVAQVLLEEKQDA